MSRTQILAAITALLLVCVIAHHIFANWGLVTIHVKETPLAKVIASISRQGHVKVKSDLPLDTPVTMDVDKVQVATAVDTLATVIEARWRLLFFAAGDKSALNTGETAWFGGQKPDDWKMLSFFQFGNMMFADDDTPVLDPRMDHWSPRTAAGAPIQDYFKEAVQATNASFAYPASWNPNVKSTPQAGTVDRVVLKLISAAGGSGDQFFFITKAGQRGPREARGDGPTTDAFQPDPELISMRIQGQINRLPPEQRAEAQASFDTEQAFRKSVEGLDPDARRQAWQQHMQDPQVQQRMADRMDGRDARLPHAQRMQRMQRYLQRKLTAMGKL